MNSQVDDEQELHLLLDKLGKAVAEGDSQRYAEIYRQALGIGQPLAPLLRERLLKTDYKKVSRSLISRFFTAQFQLLHEIDPSQSQDLAGRLAKRDCAPSIQAAMRSVLNNRREDFETEIIHGIQVHFKRSLDMPEPMRARFHRWLAVPPQDHLHKLDQIFVVGPGESGPDELGHYDSSFNRICIQWDKSYSAKKFARYFYDAIGLGSVLFHEIGHHVLNHQNGTQDTDQEKAVNYYSVLMQAKLYPVAFKFVHFTAWCIFSRKLTLLGRFNWHQSLNRHWKGQGIELKSGASEKQLQSFEAERNCALPREIRKLFIRVNGMEPQMFCANGFRFYGLEDCKIVEEDVPLKDGSLSRRQLLFAEHLPTGVHYTVPLDQVSQASTPVFRSGCRTKSGYLEAASALHFFVRKYLSNSPYLFA